MENIYYPEHEKLKALENKNQVVGAFLEWLTGQYYLCEIPEGMTHTWQPIRKSMLDLLSDYFGIDQQKLEEEKRSMLESIRKTNG